MSRPNERILAICEAQLRATRNCTVDYVQQPLKLLAGWRDDHRKRDELIRATLKAAKKGSREEKAIAETVKLSTTFGHALDAEERACKTTILPKLTAHEQVFREKIREFSASGGSVQLETPLDKADFAKTVSKVVDEREKLSQLCGQWRRDTVRRFDEMMQSAGIQQVDWRRDARLRKLF